MERDVTDIEDIVNSLDDTDRKAVKRHVLPRKLRRREALNRERHVITSGESNIPALERIYLKTWGCSHNSSDGEYMAGQLGAFGYSIIGDDKRTYNSLMCEKCISPIQ